ncbi:hypothetical protein L6R50_16560 [Myxococcota bacterium]|nr:hypothetical protein [Myxococcota bacterium]
MAPSPRMRRLLLLAPVVLGSLSRVPAASAAGPPVEVIWLPRAGDPAEDLPELYRLLPRAASMLVDPRDFTVHPASSVTVQDALREADPRVRANDCPEDDSWLWQRFVPTRLAKAVARASSPGEYEAALGLFDDLLAHIPCAWTPVSPAELRTALVLTATAALRAGRDESEFLDAAVAADPTWEAADDSLPEDLRPAWSAARSRHFQLAAPDVELVDGGRYSDREILIDGRPLPLPRPGSLRLRPGHHLVQAVEDGTHALSALFTVPADGPPGPLRLADLLPELTRDPDAELTRAFRDGEMPEWMWQALLGVERRRGRQYTFLAALTGADDPGAPVPGLRIWYLDPEAGPRPLPKELWGSAFRAPAASRLGAALSANAWRGPGVGGNVALDFTQYGGRSWLGAAGDVRVRLWRPLHLRAGGLVGTNLGFGASGGGDAGGARGLMVGLARLGVEARTPIGPIRPYGGADLQGWITERHHVRLAPAAHLGVDFRRPGEARGPFVEGGVTFPTSGDEGTPEWTFGVEAGWRWDP